MYLERNLSPSQQNTQSNLACRRGRSITQAATKAMAARFGTGGGIASGLFNLIPVQL